MLCLWWPLGWAGKNRHCLKTGDIVRCMGKHYRVGTSMTHASIELVDLKRPLQGLWVSRDKVDRGVPSEIPVFLDKEQT